MTCLKVYLVRDDSVELRHDNIKIRGLRNDVTSYFLEDETTDSERASEEPDSGVNSIGNMLVNSARDVNFDLNIVAKGENETEL